MSAPPKAHATHGAAAAATGHDSEHPHHIASAALFLRVLIALLILTGITVGSSRIDFGGANMLISMVIACIKASLVIAIFMHVWWDTAINKIFFLGSFLFLSLLFTFTLADYATRGRDEQMHRIKAPVDKQWVHLPVTGKQEH
ncbi:MAG TPA: cytochrome C oxidase subunit IV family protein [Planctomycetota bacterium]|nr:cytochrome C oxidase subunit IV family protein [Planctomycetota bacterium]